MRGVKEFIWIPFYEFEDADWIACGQVLVVERL
jgi:hypothetical protein